MYTILYLNLIAEREREINIETERWRSQKSGSSTEKEIANAQTFAQYSHVQKWQVAWHSATPLMFYKIV